MKLYYENSRGAIINLMKFPVMAQNPEVLAERSWGYETETKQDGTKNDIAITGANAQQVYYSRLNDIDESSVYDNSFIKLREVAVSYKVLQKKWMELSVNAFARNILVWAQMPDLDPEASQGNNNMSGAFEDYSMPQTASFGFGFNIKF